MPKLRNYRAENARRRQKASPTPAQAPTPMLDGASVPDVPMLHDALAMLCEALQVHYEDNQPAWLELETLPGRAAQGHAAAAWRRAVFLLEGALGTPVRGEQ